MGAEDVQAIVAKVQQTVYPRRIRIKEMFRDYDPRRSWRVSKSQFIRSLDTAGIKITHAEAAALADAYMEPNGDVHYGRFADDVDAVFGEKHLEGKPDADVLPPGATVAPLFNANQVGGEDNEEVLEYVLHRIALLCKTRGIVFKYCFEDFDKLSMGCVTESQFRRNFPLTGHFADEEMAILVERYTDKSRTLLNGVNYRALHDDVSEIPELSGEPPFPRSDLVLRPDDAQWEAQDYSPEQKVQARVVERRIRLREPFADFDPLRKGFATVGQVRSVLDMLNIPISQADFDALAEKYTREDGMFHYASFCDAVDEAFSVKGLETAPMTRISMPDASTTLPSRRNRMKLTAEDTDEIGRIEEDVSARVQQRRIQLKPYFQDFDPCRRGHISKSQFARAMGSLGFELTEEEVNLVAAKYCDLGNKYDLNYIEFIKTCDPPIDTLLAKEDRRVNLKPDNSYFERTYMNGDATGPAAVAGRCMTVVPQEVSGAVNETKLDRTHGKILSTN